MASISFFTPVVYRTPIVTLPERALEIVDECFYWGGKPRVSIFQIEQNKPGLGGQKDWSDRHRSWLNIALKVGLIYCTVIPALVLLVIKVSLRLYLKISSVQLQKGSWEGSCYENQWPKEIFERIVLYMSYRDQSQLALVAHFAHDAVRNVQTPYIQIMRSCKAKIDAIPKHQALTPEQTLEFLIQLTTASAQDSNSYWIPPLEKDVWNSALGRLESRVDLAYFSLTDLVKTPLTYVQIYRLCRCLGLLFPKELVYTWRGYLDFQSYLQKPGLDSEAVKKAMQEYLVDEASRRIQASLPDQPRLLKNTGKAVWALKVQIIDIDPRVWFGAGSSPPWQTPGSTLPDPLQEVILARLLQLRDACPERPTIVEIDSRIESRPPSQFLLPLAQKIINAEIFLDSNCIDTSQLSPSPYLRRFNELDEQNQQMLMQKYSKARQCVTQ